MITTTTEAAARLTPSQSLRTHRAAVITNPGTVELREVPTPPAAANQVRVRVTHCGVCSSSVPLWEGRPWFEYPLLPGAPGHEAIGTIDYVGEKVTGWNLGDRVAYIGEHGFAELENVAADDLFRLPNNLRDTLFLAEPMACAMNVFRRSNVQPGDVVAIVGIGFLGALLSQLAIQAGARVLAIGRRESSVAAASLFGAEGIVSPNASVIVEEVSRRSAGKMCDVVIEATGHSEPLDLAGLLTRVRGRLVVAGYHQDGLRQVNMQLWNWRGIDVINAHERDTAVYLEGMELARRAVTEGRLVTKGLITHTFGLEDLGHALCMAAERPIGFVKAVVVL